MHTTLHTEWTVADICDGFVYNELEGKGLFGMGGRLTIQPEYQRNYIYADGRRDVAVIDSVLRPRSRRQRRPRVETRGNGCRPRGGMEQGRSHRHQQLPNALQDAQPGERE